MKNHVFNITFLFVACWFLLSLADHFPVNVLSWDNYGAYLHLPANFIYKDPFLTDWSWLTAMNEKYNATPTYYQFWQADTGNYVIKYPLGFALIYAPFFFLGHHLAPTFGFAQDGFSAPYQWAIITGHVFYVLLGLWFAGKVLLCYFSQHLTALLLLLLFAGTNFLFTTTAMVAMPHGHLFLFYALLLLFTKGWHETPNFKNSISLGLVIGIAALIRGTELLMILIPALWHVSNKETLKQKWLWMKAHKNRVWLVLGVMMVIGSIQLVYYKLATGHFFVDAYNNAGEGFDFLSPHTLDFLFSARKGWLVYTPLFALSFFGFWFMKRKNRPDFLPLFVFSMVNIFVLSSWTCWWYAESFGQRALVQSYLVLLIPSGFFLQEVHTKKWPVQVLTGVVIVACIALNLFQTWQIHHGLLHPSRMTPEAYWAHFLKTAKNPEFNNMLLVDKNVPALDRLSGNQDNLKISKVLRARVVEGVWQGVESDAGAEWQGVEANSEQIYSKDFVVKYSEVTRQRNVIFRLEAWVYCNGKPEEVLPRVVFKMLHRGKPYYDQYIEVEKQPHVRANTWTKVEHVFYSADVRNMTRDEIQSFAWMAGNGSFKMDNIRLTVYEGLR